MLSESLAGLPQCTDQQLSSLEKAVLALAKLYSKMKQSDKLEELLESSRTLLVYVSKAKAAKIVRSLIDAYLDMHEGKHSVQDAKVSCWRLWWLDVLGKCVSSCAD